MKRKESFFPAFFIVSFLSILILVLSFSHLNFLSSFLEKGTSVIQAITFGAFQKLPFLSNEKTQKLEDQNLELLSRIKNYERLAKENQALSDQFKTTYPSSINLLKAEIIGAPSFIPGISVPNNFILNKGSEENVKVGNAVVILDNLIGVISQISPNISKVTVINNSSFSFTAKTQNGALGVLKGGSSLTLDNVLLSENIRPKELVLTKGDVNSQGVGIPPDLIVGKIMSVEKNPSSLFQKAKLESFVDFAKLSTVFVYINN